MKSLLERIYDASVRLCGGYYEPKSDKDAEIGALLHDAYVNLNNLIAEVTYLRSKIPHNERNE